MRIEKLITEKDLEIEICRQKLTTSFRLLLADEIPQSESIDALFINARAVGDIQQPGRPGNDDGQLFEYAGQLFDGGRVKNILLPGSDGQQWVNNSPIVDRYEKGIDKQKANAGVSEYLRKLAQVCNIGIQNIFFTGAEVGNTREENIAFADELEKHEEWKSVALICHPHQVLRNFAGQINENKKRELNVRVYSAHPRKTDWEEEVGGSQGQNHMLRKDHALPEMQRVAKYTPQLKNLATPDEILEYLKKRDGSLDRLNTLLKVKMQNPDFQKDIEVVENAINSLTPQELEGLTNLQN